MDAREEDLTVQWFKVYAEIASHKKTRRIPRDQVSVSTRVAALGVWLAASCWTAERETDGFIPEEEMERWDPTGDVSAALVEAGYFEHAIVDGERGYYLHDWLDWQDSVEELEAKRAYTVRKNAMHRDPALIADVRKRDQDRCRFCGVLVNWHDRRSAAGGTYVHIDPVAGNTLDNVVVACRGCGSGKPGQGPPRNASSLLEPGSTGRSSSDLVRNQIGARSEPGEFCPLDIDLDLDKEQKTSPTAPRSRATSKAASKSSGTPREQAAAKFGGEFEEWYAAYPRHEDPQDAAKAWMKVRRTVSHDELMAATRRYAASRQDQDRQYTKLPATWLNKGSYASEPDRPRLAAVPDQRPPAQVYADLWDRADATTAAKLLRTAWIDPFRKPSDPDPTPYELWVRARRREFIAEHHDEICAALEARRAG